MAQRGRPRVQVDVEVAEQLLNSGRTLTWIATCFQVYTAEPARLCWCTISLRIMALTTVLGRHIPRTS